MRFRATLGVLLLSGLIVGSMFIAPGGGAAPVDVVMILAILHALLSGFSGCRTSPGIRDALILTGGALGIFLSVALISVTVHSGSLAQMLIDLVSVTYLLVPLFLLGLSTRRSEMAAIWLVLGVASAVFAFTAIVEDDYRSSGLMGNPNMAGAWIGCAVILLVAKEVPLPRIVALSGAAFLTLALVSTDSYAALLGIAFSLSYLLLTGRHRVLGVVLAILGVCFLALRWNELSLLEPTRLDSSRGVRSQIWHAALAEWERHPMGIGHGNFTADSVFPGALQTHNDYLAVLVENGILGLAALFLIGVALWRVGSRITRGMLVFVAFEALFHNVLNFRHVWLFLSLAIALDVMTKRAQSQDRPIALDSPPAGSIRGDARA